jgi:3'(2'), 5'-bisphosphate nucleotidase
MLDEELATVADLARQAGRILLEVYASNFKVDFKAGTDPVTDADRRANDFLVRGLSQRFPLDGIVAEESEQDDRALDHERCWFVDPLDGTREFVARNGEFAVMLGLAIRGRASLGVVFQPVTGKLYCGRVGGRARLEQDGQVRELVVSDHSSPGDLGLVVSRSHRPGGTDELMRRLGIRQEKPSGSVGLKIGCIAERDADLYVHLSARASKWDACGPEAILRAAGGRFTDLLGAEFDYREPDPRASRGILACNSAAFEAVAPVVRELAEERGFRGQTPA